MLPETIDTLSETHDTLSATTNTLPITFDTLTDTRDGKTYRTVKIGKQTWMAENLQYKTSDSSWCYDHKGSNCAQYGRLYAWNAAMTACSDGYHLPIRQEWDDLALAAGGKRLPDKNGYDNIYWYGAGKELKAQRGWNWIDYDDRSGNGTDNFGFSALPGGYLNYNVGSFAYPGRVGSWWMATEYDERNAYYWKMYDNIDRVDESNAKKSYSELSVRCIAD
jgi:uncharacterized protein (TIGR02145 family)